MTVPMPPMAERTLVQVLRHNAEHRPDRPALRDSSVSLTHAELLDRVCRCAGGLRRAGVAADDVVVMMLDNSIDYFVVFAAISFLGAVSVPTNTAYKGTILHHVLADSRADHAVVEGHYRELVADAAGAKLRSLVVRGPDGGPAPADGGERAVHDLAKVLDGPAVTPLAVGPWQPLAVMYTSGTTGPSKGALASHASAYSVSFLPEIQGPHDESDVVLVVCPMFHTTGLFGGAFGALIVGATVSVVPGFSASRFWTDVDEAGAISTVLVGAMCDFLMQQPARPDDREHSLRTVFTVPRPASMAAFMHRFGVATTTAFGGTEAGSVITNLGVEPGRLGSVGRLRRGMCVRLVDEHDQEVPPGQPGEAIVRTDEPWTLPTGYVNNPEANAALWRNGWMHTGDLLERDADGWFSFVDRMKDSLRRRGENISSVEVEAETVAHPDVLECAAVGVGDDATDQEVKIVVRLRSGAGVTPGDLVRHLVDRLPYYAVPRYVSVVDDFPRTPTGKVRKADLRRMPLTTWDREDAGIEVRRARPNRGAAAAQPAVRPPSTTISAPLT